MDIRSLQVGFTLLSREPVAYSFALGSSRTIRTRQIFTTKASNMGLQHFFTIN